MKKLWLAFLEGVRFYLCVVPKHKCVVPKSWWSRFLPSRKYIEFRRHTAYGMKEHDWGRPPLRKQLEDIMRFLLWRRELRRAEERRESR